MLRLGLLGILVTATLGCGAGHKMMIGQMHMVENSGDKPGWLNLVPDSDRTNMYWVGRKSEGDTEDGVVTDAREDCTRQLADYLKNTANKLYEKGRTERAATTDLGTVRPYINDLFKAWYRKVQAQGLKTKEVYWERHEKLVAQGRVRYLYKGYVLMKLDKKLLASLGQQSLKEQLDKARAAGDAAAQKALEAMDGNLRAMEN